MDAKLNRRFPSVRDMQPAAKRRVPKFLYDYLAGGIGRGDGMRKNRAALDRVHLLPRYLIDADTVDTSVTLFGQQFSAPFGVAPVGNGGAIWPGAGEALAQQARQRNQPFGVSTVAVSTLEALKDQAGDMAWFQLYRPNVAAVEADMLARIKAAGYKVLMITVDIPGPLRRDHDLKNNFTSDFTLWDARTLLSLARCPHWSITTARHGYPKLASMMRYAPAEGSMTDRTRAISRMFDGHVTLPILQHLRDSWDGILLAKGILDPRDAVACKEIGLDGIIVSNHGGRQLEAAPTAVEMLPIIRQQVGEQYPLLADGGVETGLDICRLLAVGADMVLVGRGFYYAMGAMGLPGAAHVFDVLQAELTGTMVQLGARTVPEIPECLYSEFN